MQRESDPTSHGEPVARPNPVLDYSSPAAEQVRCRTPEQERREALEAYNEAEFGERRPIVSVLVQIAVLAAILCVLAVFLPRGVARILDGIVIVGFIAWRARNGGLSSNPSTSIRNPYRFRWW
jgi:hypothetical protein